MTLERQQLETDVHNSAGEPYRGEETHAFFWASVFSGLDGVNLLLLAALKLLAAAEAFLGAAAFLTGFALEVSMIWMSSSDEDMLATV